METTQNQEKIEAYPVQCVQCGRQEVILYKPHESVVAKLADWIVHVGGLCRECGRAKQK